MFAIIVSAARKQVPTEINTQRHSHMVKDPQNGDRAKIFLWEYCVQFHLNSMIFQQKILNKHEKGAETEAFKRSRIVEGPEHWPYLYRTIVYYFIHGSSFGHFSTIGKTKTALKSIISSSKQYNLVRALKIVRSRSERKKLPHFSRFDGNFHCEQRSIRDGGHRASHIKCEFMNAITLQVQHNAIFLTENVLQKWEHVWLAELVCVCVLVLSHVIVCNLNQTMRMCVRRYCFREHRIAINV